MEIINYLQLFAEAGSVVNATGGYVDAHTGASEGFSGSNTLSPELKTFYDTELLNNTRVELYYAQFGKKQPLPEEDIFNMSSVEDMIK